MSYWDTVDWNEEVNSQPHVYKFAASFDVIDRIELRTADDGTITMYEYDTNGLLFAVKIKFPG